MADQKPLVQIAGQVQQIPAGDKIPVANLATGTPDGTKFIRDDGVLITPVGGTVPPIAKQLSAYQYGGL